MSRALFLLVSIFLVSCVKSRPYEDYPRSEYPYETTDPDSKATGSAPSFIKNYSLSVGGIETAKGPSSVSPFAVFVAVRDGSFSRCTATHWTLGHVLTNAHCVKDTDQAKNLYLVYWDKTGKEKWAQVTEIESKGFEMGVDAAFLKIKPEDAATWDVFKGDYDDTATLIGAELGTHITPITIWAMDHKGSSGYYYSYLRQKKCRASPRTKFLVIGFKSPSTVRTTITYPNEDETYHLFYDQCSPYTIGGNSGSLITDDSTGKALGIHFSSEKTPSLKERAYTDLEITGADGKVINVSTATEQYVAGTGVAIDYLLTYFHLR